MILGSLCVGVHMSMTQGVGFGMLATYIPADNIPGIGKITGTIWSITDLLLGTSPHSLVLLCVTQGSHPSFPSFWCCLWGLGS